MIKFNFKQRCFFTLVDIVVIALAIGCVFSGGGDLGDYLNYPSSVYYSSGSVFAVLSPILFIPFLLSSIYPIFRGTRAPSVFNKKLAIVMVYGFLMSVVITLVFRSFYTNALEHKGYIACKGMPTGYMLGMATQYVTDPNLCEGYIKHHK